LSGDFDILGVLGGAGWTIAASSAASCNDLATMAIAKVIIGLARGAERLCALALKRISK